MKKFLMIILLTLTIMFYPVIDVNAAYDGEYLEIELGYTLPAAKIGINLVYNNTGAQKNGMKVYTIGTYGRITLTAFEDMYPGVDSTYAIINVIVLDDNWNMNILHDSLASQEFGSTRGILSVGMIIDLSSATPEERTITEITTIGETAIDGIFIRILTIDETIYNEGYAAARERYGYYDHDTDQWLSVDEYLELYDDEMDQNDFYNNFDKYFIPAMIIVFGGAIVLTILKVFKRRE